MIVSAALWKEVMFLDNFSCVYCGEHSSELTVDHFIPASLGGPDVIQNLVAACASCNGIKSSRAPYECECVPQFGRHAYVADAFREKQGVVLGRFSVREFARLFNIPETTLRRQLAQSEDSEGS